MSQVPEPVTRESTPLTERLIRQHRCAQGVAIQSQLALAAGSGAASIAAQNALTKPPLISPQSASQALKPQNKFHFGLAPMDISSQGSSNYQQPSVKNENEGL
ncbi:hypothetical protein FGADI_5419 [Fusarium gaditjirri]|uniref:Uncharacterized protein n=1 Tax=Fusarium gaditjirri TaxID=282569 RepID=A0A8H4TAE3_9HYPO|nr:hypothetical protein FGADI_5419 [Fusarium gaditjirri]